ncbi:c-type cytochrome [Sulfuricystis multivorans]|uniref:c-type cytochrome n=1 Tax=Sulfuricystis multivorans TaxID=2211108 RepID=UPI000F838BA5|nr:c-type cytochrome [Sulfuricystis multivorans]
MPMLTSLRIFCFAFGLVFLPARAHAAAPEQESGKEIYGPCAACHGDLGQGGKRGEYPRLAGQRAAYIEYTLKKFRSRERINIPMFPYTQERELPDEDIKTVAAYLAGIQLSTKIPDFKPTDDALTRLLAMEKVMIIPKLEGDLENGKRLYQEECAYCHGIDGRGKTRFPMLVGQYTNYLQKQINAYIKGERLHDKVADDEDEEDGKSKPKTVKLGVLNRLTEKDIQDILAYITHLQDE